MSKLFHKYNSLTNHYSEKFINAIMTNGLDYGDWVATEKVHGANYSIWCDETDTWTARRTGIIGDGTSFFSSHKLNKYLPEARETYDRLVQEGLIKHGDIMTIFGEIFGGSFFGSQEPGSKAVQGGMNYHPGTEFAAYDIAVCHADGTHEFLSYLDMLEILDGTSIKACPEVGRGTLYDILKLDNNFPSKVPELFGLKVPEGKHAQSEGFVIRPLDGERYMKAGRCIIKSKNAVFNERGGKTKSAGSKTEALKMTEVEEQMFRDLSVYFNQVRLESVLSKYGEVTWNDFRKVSGLLIQDATDDFEKDCEITLRDNDFWAKAERSIGALSGEIVREYFKRIL